MRIVSFSKMSLLGVVLSLSACDFMYDEADESNSNVTESSFSNVDATAYDSWTYISMSKQTKAVVDITNTEAIPSDWDFAIHRYDIKTNGGAVWQTPYSTLSAFQESGASPSSGSFVEDVWTTDEVISDASDMMNGNLKYDSTYLNPEMSKWMNLDTSNMPPSYLPSNLVYVLRLKDGTYAAVRFTDFMDGNGTKGFISFDYVYPLK